MKRIFSLDKNGKLELDFHYGQGVVWDSKARFILMLAGTQGGKTVFGPWWLLREIQRTCDPGGLNNDYIAVTTTFPLFSLKMLPEIRYIFEDLFKWGRYWAGVRVMELHDPKGNFWARRGDDHMWGRIHLRSIGAAGGLEAATAKAIWADEIGMDRWDITDWEAMNRRVSMTGGRILGTTTPYNSGWIKTEIFDPWREGNRDFNVVQFPSWWNPSFPAAEFARSARTLPTWRFNMFYRGVFARPEGMIYNAFIDEPETLGGHLVEPFEIPDGWLRICGSDFGGANTANIWLAHDPNRDIWYVYDEYLGGGTSIKKHADRLTRHDESVVIKYYGGASSETQERMDYEEAGISMQEPPVKELEVGISRVIQLINEDRFRVFRTLSGLRHEISTYRRKTDDSGNVLDDILDKRRFHRLDGLRYGIVGITTKLKKKRVRARSRV